MDLAGWTNDRLVADRIARLPQSEWVYRPAQRQYRHGRVPARGARRHALQRAGARRLVRRRRPEHRGSRSGASSAARGGGASVPGMTRTYRCYSARLAGSYLDIRGEQAELADVYAPDSYAASQVFGERLQGLAAKRHPLRQRALSRRRQRRRLPAEHGARRGPGGSLRDHASRAAERRIEVRRLAA